MKKILTIFILLFSLFFIKESKAQNVPSTYIDWQLSNQSCYGCASFYWKVNRSYSPEMRSYRFDIWFSSNSFYPNGGYASTYLTGVYIYSDGYLANKEPFWFLFKEQATSNLSQFYSQNLNPAITITWQNLTIY